MAGPMRDNSLDNSHRTKVADPRGVTAAKAETNFEYDDNEWDIGIGDLIIDLDADIEKTNERSGGSGSSSGSMASATGQVPPSKGKLAIEHSATVDKGLKMKIKRTKPGGKTSEAKHEIVKSGEQQNGTSVNMSGEKHTNSAGGANANANLNSGVKRGSSGHRRDKTRDKHENSVNGVVRPGPPVQRVVFPVTVSGPGPPGAPGPPPSEPPPSPASAPPPASTPPAPILEEPKTVPVSPGPIVPAPSTTPTPASPPAKKVKTCPSDISKDMVDVCVGTSVATITEPDCLGPCEPGTSVTLEGIVWHETEGVLVVNVTWRGKTYVGTLLDCTRHDWAPPRFCDSPTSDLDARTPKGRGKRGRQGAGVASNDLSNFTETRSSVHSKLRSNNNNGAKGRRNPGGPGSPTPFVPPKPETTPGKRKPKAPEEETPAKKSKPPPTPTPAPTPTPTPTPTPPPVQTSSSPPPSPVLLECPEPNCSKKYKHINGLKYHQSHAHGSADDEETKESAGSLSEAEETPSPAPVVKKEAEPSPTEVPVLETQTPITQPLEVQTPSPQQLPSTPTPAPTPTLEVEAPPPPLTPEKSVIKPGVLRFGTQEEALLTIPSVPPAASRPIQTTPSLQPSSPRVSSPSPGPINPQPIQLVIQPQQQPVTPHVVQIVQSLAQQNPAINAKVPQFKVKPTSVLMPDEKKPQSQQVVNVKHPNHKKKSRKSPAGSPHPHPHLLDPQPLGLETTGREDVQSPAYSDISDDGAPVLESEVDNSKIKSRPGDKKEVNSGQSPHSMQHYNMYPYYGQPPYLVPSVTPTDNKQKDNASDKSLEAKPGLEKEKKEGGNMGGEFQQKMLPQHYYPYGYVPGYPYNLEPGFSVPMVTEDKGTVIKEEKSPGPNENIKQNMSSAPTPLHVPNPSKIKTEPGSKEKHPNENHQILKESIEMKNQMSPAYMYPRTQQQPGQQVQQDEMRRYYLYSDRRKEHSGQSETPQVLKATPPPQPKPTVPAQSPKHKEKPLDDKKEDKIKQEGVKPTMETQGPPPPPTSSYAYIHPGYMQSPHYGAIPFDPSHPMYARSINPMIVPSPYSNSPYMHPQLHPPMPRYHAPEDLSRPPTGGPKALDLLQHHANQYYTSHKIHELQERALKSPTPKASVASPSPSAERQNVGSIPGPQNPPTSNPSQAPAQSGKPGGNENKDSRSPPPQRHVHTHHHTHVGLGYPILGQYPAPYGAAVLASQQAAAVAASASVVPSFSPK